MSPDRPPLETHDGVILPPPDEPRRPRVRLTPGEWLRENLFSTWYNTVLTVVFGLALGWATFSAMRFAFVSAEWEIIRVNLTNLLVGLFPRAELWRAWLALYVGVATLGAGTGVAVAALAQQQGEAAAAAPRLNPAATLRRTWPIVALLVVLLVFSGAVVPVGLAALLLVVGAGAYLLGRTVARRVRGGVATVAMTGFAVSVAVLIAFDGVAWDRWGGLLLTLYLAVTGIVLSFPVGIAFALGRRSSLPVVRTVSVAYIELFRGVPLITVLFMGSEMLRFFFPPGFRVPSLLVRAVIAITLFTGAYIAEIVRGGLQSVPRGQVEAAQAVGLSALATTRLIVLPQALRAVIPAIVSQFISLFKDTSLVFIIALQDFLFITQSITNQPRFFAQGLQAETLTFAAFVYWVFTYTMSRESQRLERRLGLGER